MRAFIYTFTLGIIFSGCSASINGAGEVVHRVVTCTDAESCKAEMVKNCPEGGQLHGVLPSITVEYSCE